MDLELPDEFGAGGQALFDDLTSDSNDASTAALVVEAARTKDRLDRLNRLTAGDADAWAHVVTVEGEIVLKIDSAVAEQRQLSTVFRQLLAEIQRRQGDRGTVGEADPLADL